MDGQEAVRAPVPDPWQSPRKGEASAFRRDPSPEVERVCSPPP